MASKTGPLERAQARFCGGDSVSRCSEIWHPKVHFTLHPEQDIDAPLDSLQVSQRAPARDLAKIPPAWLSRPARGSLFYGASEHSQSAGPAPPPWGLPPKILRTTAARCGAAGDSAMHRAPLGYVSTPTLRRSTRG